MVNIGERVKARRQKLGWSQQKLADLAVLHPSHVSRLESGKANVSHENLYAVAGALGISVEKLIATDGNVEDAPADFRRVPVLDSVQAGRWMSVDTHLMDDEIREYVSVNFDCPPSTFAMYIKGDSMEPEFKPGDMVLIAPPVQPVWGDCVVATDETGDATFKEYANGGINERGERVILLVAQNPAYGTMRSDREKFAIVGPMIEHRRRRKRI